jgi:hypothetical protein
MKDELEHAIVKAEDDSVASLTHARRILERVLRDVYDRHIQGEKAGNRPLENLLQRLVKDGHFPGDLGGFAYAVKELGNRSAHDLGKTFPLDYVVPVLNQLILIVGWYCEHEYKDASSPNHGDGHDPAADMALSEKSRTVTMDAPARRLIPHDGARIKFSLSCIVGLGLLPLIALPIFYYTSKGWRSEGRPDVVRVQSTERARVDVADREKPDDPVDCEIVPPDQAIHDLALTTAWSPKDRENANLTSFDHSGRVKDESNSLEWKLKGERICTFENARERARRLIDETSDWRVPNAKELLSLVSRNRVKDSYIDQRFLKVNDGLRDVWTSTCASEAEAYYVNFQEGILAHAPKSDQKGVLFVRTRHAPVEGNIDP